MPLVVGYAVADCNHGWQFETKCTATCIDGYRRPDTGNTNAECDIVIGGVDWRNELAPCESERGGERKWREGVEGEGGRERGGTRRASVRER